MSADEVEFHSVLFTRLLDCVRENETPFDEPTSGKTTESGVADIYVPSAPSGEIVIQVTRDDTYPRAESVTQQARDCADDLCAEFFATCNSNDLFLFRDRKDTDTEFHYLNLREPDLMESVSQLLGIVAHAHEAGSLPGQTERARFLGTVRSFHGSIWPIYRRLARKQYGSNEQFTRRFDQWVRENDHSTLEADEQFEMAGKQYACMLTNRLLFYEVIRAKTGSESGSETVPETETGGNSGPETMPDTETGGESGPETVPETETGSGQLDPLHGHTNLSNLEDHIRTQFRVVVEEIGYGPVFDDGASLFAEFPQNRRTLRTVEAFLQSIETGSIERLDEDILGELYEELIPATERRMLGQYYTPPRIAETLASWAIPDHPDDGVPRVLDPASGSGVFTVEAYRQLEALPSQPGHQTVVNHLVSVDVNRFPLHLTALNVASQNLGERADRIHTHHDSFFDISPDDGDLCLSGTEADEERGTARFDAVIGNPPYIDQRRLYPDTEHFRRHLKKLGPDGSRPYYDGDSRLSRRCDVYVYFLTHATQFLDTEGRLGYIVPTKWMTTGYGEAFQEFLHDHYRLRAVVAFGARAFEDAFVDGALLMLERCDDERARRNNVVKFVRVTAEMEPQAIVDAVEHEPGPGDSRELTVRRRDTHRTVAVSQGYLMDRESKKIGHFVSAPLAFIELLENPRVTPLENLLADSSRGVTTGDNDFFLIDEADAETRGIDSRFLTPVIRWIKQMQPQSNLTEDSTDVCVLDVHDYVKQARLNRSLEQSDAEEQVKSRLQEDGHTALLDYVRAGEAQGVDERRTCAARTVWFDVGELERADILHPKGFKYRLFCLRNVDSLAANNRLYHLHPARGVDTMALLGVLNSTVYQAAVETLGRSEGRGMLELSKGDLLSLPVLDVRKLNAEQKRDIRDAFVRWEAGVEGAQDALDRVIVEGMSVDIEVEELQEIREAVTQERNNRGTTSEVMLSRVDTPEDTGTHTVTVGTEDAEDAGSSDSI
ncbi:MAG: type I restriction-modification system methyltransferase subunit [halophilic archaeon J07HX64]|jgi:Type I restriction-modification system methyltransferase subunit|nr:MAG: type I restriction-modification system methyltransferase subunit [halophilic archaeon J07HX64]